MQWWHVVWTTALVWSPADARGDWSALSVVYAKVADRRGPVRMSHPLDRVWQARLDERAVALSPAARTLVADAIRELANDDRVAGDTPIRALSVQPHAVQIVLACPDPLLQQRVGRLKSRSATLLSFDPGAGAGGKGTWSRGFWWARLSEEDVPAAESYVQGLGG